MNSCCFKKLILQIQNNVLLCQPLFCFCFGICRTPNNEILWLKQTYNAGFVDVSVRKALLVAALEKPSISAVVDLQKVYPHIIVRVGLCNETHLHSWKTRKQSNSRNLQIAPKKKKRKNVVKKQDFLISFQSSELCWHQYAMFFFQRTSYVIINACLISSLVW